jgi:hypothetical protein
LVRIVVATSDQAWHRVREMQTAISEFITVHNQQPKPFVWTKSADDIRSSIGRGASLTLAVHSANNK